MKLTTPLLSLLTLATALPTTGTELPTADALLADRAASTSDDWQLHDLRIFTAKTNTQGASYITFLFQDTRPKFPLKTECSRVIFPGEADQNLHDDRLIACANNTVGWSYNGRRFDVQRSYVDPSVGPPGMDVVTAFGHAKPGGKTTTGGCGTTTQAKLVEVPITAMIA